MELLNWLIGVLSLIKEKVEWMADRPALLIAIGALAASLYSIHRSKRMAQYIYLANIWFKIKDEGFKRHDFIDPNKTTAYKTYFTGDRLTDYNIFAYMCWAHAEDICLNRWHRKWYGRGSTCYTSTIQDFKKLHYTWLMQPNNSQNFNPRFKKYIGKLHLFSLDAKKIEDELNKVELYEVKQVSYALKKEFKNEGFLLDNATITKIKNKKWEITTILENNQKTLKEDAHKVRSNVTFIIRKKYGKLKIYNEFPDIDPQLSLIQKILCLFGFKAPVPPLRSVK